MNARERPLDGSLAWWRRAAVALMLTAIALASLAGAAPSAGQDTPTPTGPIDLSLDLTCRPDTFRPDEYVAVECVTRLANQGQNTLTDVSSSISSSSSGPIPSYFFMWSRRGEGLLPVGTGVLSFQAGDLAPGQTVVTGTVVLLKMEEGTFETELRVSVGEQEVAKAPIRFVATPGAAEPPTDVLVTTELVDGVSDEPQPTAAYQTTIANQGSTEVSELTLSERYSGSVTLVGAEPGPISQNPAVQLASWDLASFGKGSLAPGESLVLRTTYGPAEGADCGWVSSGVVVEATGGGQEQRYGARPSAGASVGECRYPQIGGGGEFPTTLSRGGGGPVSSGGGASWLVAALAGVGVTLIAAALSARRARL